MSRTKSYAFFIPSFRGGGAEKVMIEVANQLAKESLDIYLVVGSSEGPYKSNVDPRVSIVCLNRDSMMRCIPGLARFMLREKPFSIVSTMLYANLALSIASILVFSKSRLIAREALPIDVELSESRFRKFLAYVVYRRFDVVISLNNCLASVRKKHAFLGKFSREAVIPNPLDLKELTLLWDEDPEFLVPEKIRNIPIIVACGRLTKQKGFDTLVRAYSLLTKDIDCALIILGEGELRSHLIALGKRLGVDEKIWMPGFVRNPHPYVRISEVFVMPSLYEGMPNALLHAYAFGNKCVASNCECGPKDIFKNSGEGLLVEPGNVEELSKAMREMLLKTNGEKVRAGWISEYGIEKVASLYKKEMQGYK